ncbi:hypothetical protein F5B20DRAFT_567372 [Whalleya microplaca]|nr:hypothetical protein F5B20DRAFT_567372 [Whalleya microplaca]
MAMTALPTYPVVVFGIIEPALLIWAYISALRSPSTFFYTQIPPSSPLSSPNPNPNPNPPDLSPQAHILTLQLANVYLLLAALGVLCASTSHARVARWYLAAVAAADWGHVWAVRRGAGAAVFWDVRRWNDMLWGGVGVSVLLNALRVLTLLGAFGPVRDGGRRDGGGKGE